MPHITVNDQIPRVVFAVGAVPTTGPFNFAFEFFDNADLKVYIGGVLANYNPMPTLATEYSVTGTAVDGGYEGGFVTIGANISNTTVVVLRDVPVARTEDFPYPSSTLDIKGVNTALDKAYAIQQQLETRLARTLRQPDADATDLAELPVAASRALKFVAFDGNGNVIVAAGTSANLGPVSGFINTLLDDADATTARATLGVAPRDPSYLVLGANSELMGKRVLGGGEGIELVDGGVALAAAALNVDWGPLRGYIAGLTLSNNGTDANNDIDIAAGVCVSDSTPLKFLRNAATLTKRLDATWAGGNNQGGLDTGAEAASTWYHVHMIGRHGLVVTNRSRSANIATLTIASHGLAVGQTILVRGVGVSAGTSYDGVFVITTVPNANTFAYTNAGTNEGSTACAGLVDGFDALFSLSVAAPTMPGGWISRRRLGSVRNDGAGNIIAFRQFGDNFMFSTPPALDVNASNPGTTAVLRTLTTPLGIKCEAIMNILDETAGSLHLTYVSDPDCADVAASRTASPLGSAGQSIAPAGESGANLVKCWTNTSSQIRTRQDQSGASDTLRIATLGWNDYRGRFA